MIFTEGFLKFLLYYFGAVSVVTFGMYLLDKIKAMSAPFPMFKVMPTGGISLKNLGEYLACPVIAACGGSYMVTADLIDNHKWDEIIDLCKKSVEIVKEARG